MINDNQILLPGVTDIIHSEALEELKEMQTEKDQILDEIGEEDVMQKVLVG